MRAAGTCKRGLDDGLQLGDFYTEIRAALEMFPSKRFGKLGLKLVPKWDRIMIIQEDKVLARCQVEPRLQNQFVLDRTWDRSNVHSSCLVQ